MRKTILAIFLGILIFTSTGCFKRDDLEGAQIYTTVYPIEYITEFLYGNSSTVDSIYPAESNLDEYTLTEKQITDYSKGDVFIYNGLSNEKSIARDLLNENTDLKIIDVSQGLEYDYSEIELWLNPRDFLMLAHNIKNGLEEYISNKYVIEEIESQYEELKLLISGFDAELEIIPDNASDTNIIVGNDTLNFLSKYGFTVTSIDEENGNLSSATISKAKKLVTDGIVEYIFVIDEYEETDTIKELVNLGAEVVIIRSMTLLTEDEIKNDVTYKTMMRDTIDAIKLEVYE